MTNVAHTAPSRSYTSSSDGAAGVGLYGIEYQGDSVLLVS